METLSYEAMLQALAKSGATLRSLMPGAWPIRWACKLWTGPSGMYSSFSKRRAAALDAQPHGLAAWRYGGLPA